MEQGPSWFETIFRHRTAPAAGQARPEQRYPVCRSGRTGARQPIRAQCVGIGSHKLSAALLGSQLSSRPGDLAPNACLGTPRVGAVSNPKFE